MSKKIIIKTSDNKIYEFNEVIRCDNNNTNEYAFLNGTFIQTLIKLSDQSEITVEIPFSNNASRYYFSFYEGEEAYYLYTEIGAYFGDNKDHIFEILTNKLDQNIKY